MLTARRRFTLYSLPCIVIVQGHCIGYAETVGPQAQHSYSFTAFIRPYPGSPTGAHALCFPVCNGLLHSRRRSACILLKQQVYPASGLSQLSPSRLSLRGCTIRFMLRPAVLAGIPDWVKHTPAPRHVPSRHRVGASSARVLPHEPAPSLHIQKGN